MKKIDKPLKASYGSIKLNLKDLMEIYSLVENNGKFCIKTEDYEFDDIESFIDEYKDRIPKEVEIKSLDPYLTITFNKFRAELYISSSDIKSSGIFHKIDGLLKRCERKPKILHNFIWINIIFWLLLGLESIPQLKLINNYINIFQTLFFFWFLYIAYIHFKKFAVINTISNKKSFFIRNSDSLIIALISAIIGAAIGTALTKTFDHVWPSKTNVMQNQSKIEK